MRYRISWTIDDVAHSKEVEAQDIREAGAMLIEEWNDVTLLKTIRAVVELIR